MKGRSSDFLDLVNHSKLTTLTRAYILEYERYHLEEDEEEDASAFIIDDYVAGKKNDREGKVEKNIRCSRQHPVHPT